MKVATALRHLTEPELASAVQRGLAYVDGDTIVPYAGGGAGFHNSDGSRLGAPDFSSSANIVATAGNGVKGSYTQVLAAANMTQDCDGLMCLLNWPSSASTLLVDIAVGAAASEVVIAPNLMAQASAVAGPVPYLFYLPTPLVSGTRIAARAIAQAASKSVGITVWPVSASYLGLMELSRITDYGSAGAAASRGTAVVASASINTKGAWTALSTSTTNDMKAVYVAIGSQGASKGTLDNRLDIGVGAAGSEVVVIPDLYFGSFTTTTHVLPALYGPILMDIPAGTRLSARTQSSTASASYDIIVYGVD